MRPLIARFIADRSGATAIEYALIATLISVALIVGARFLGVQMGAMYDAIAESVGGAGASE